MSEDSTQEVRIRFLSFEGCPGIRPALESLKTVMAEYGVTSDIEMIAVPDLSTAKQEGFLGSPTIQINGLDIEVLSRKLWVEFF